MLFGIVLASPKSQILIWQCWFINMFDGLRSLWTMLAVCIKFIAQSILYRRFFTCSYYIPLSLPMLITLLISVSTCSIIKKRTFKFVAFVFSGTIRSMSFGKKLIFVEVILVKAFIICISLIILTSW